MSFLIGVALLAGLAFGGAIIGDPLLRPGEDPSSWVVIIKLGE